MAKRRPDSKRRDLATWLMMLLPGFMFVGLLAPAAVKVKPKQDEIGPISFRNFAPRRPIQFALPAARAVLAGSRIEPMFAGAHYVEQPRNAPEDPQVDVAAAPQNDDEIVLGEDDGVENYVAETLFETPIEGEQRLAVDLTALWDSSLFDVIPDMIDRTASAQWDDFHGTSPTFLSVPGANPVIPEPATGALFAFGLAAIAVRRRHRA